MLRGPGSWVACAALAIALVLASRAPALSESDLLTVPRAPIYPGEVIAADKLTERQREPADADPGTTVYANQQWLVGKVAKQTLLPGQPVPLAAVREQYLIKQGQQARVTFQSGSLVISTTAVSLQAGGTGDLISLRNTDSGTTIRGVVQADGTIRVGSP